jgi:hypothetical protein
LSFIQEGIPYLAPNQILKSYLTRVDAVDSFTFDKLAKPFTIQIKYENIGGKKFKKIYPIDLSPLGSLTSENVPSIPKNIDKIEEHQKTISNNLGELINSLKKQ